MNTLVGAALARATSADVTGEDSCRATRRTIRHDGEETGLDSKENKKAPEGDELNAEELETVTGAMMNIGGFGVGGGTHELPPSCLATSDTGMMGCSG